MVVIGGLLVPTAAGAAPRDGLVIGGSIGRGEIALSCDSCEGVEPLTDALSISAHVGTMIDPRMAVMLDTWAVIWNGRDNSWFADSEDHVVHEVFATAAAQVWVTSRLWVRAGVGFGHYDFDEQQPEQDRSVVFLGPEQQRGSRWAPALTAAIGLAVIDKPEFSLDLMLRTGAAEHEDAGFRATNTGIVVGASWY